MKLPTIERIVPGTVAKFKVRTIIPRKVRKKGIEHPDAVPTFMVDLWFVAGTGRKGYHSKPVSTDLYYSWNYNVEKKTLYKDNTCAISAKDISNLEPLIKAIDATIKDLLEGKWN
jgi:hypothetical protein